MVMAGLARTSAFFFLSIPVMMLWTASSPAAQGMMTRRVSESEQGELQGAINSLASVAWIFGPSLFTFIFAYFIDQKLGWNIPGAPWYLGAFSPLHCHGHGNPDPAPAHGRTGDRCAASPLEIALSSCGNRRNVAGVISVAFLASPLGQGERIKVRGPTQRRSSCAK